MADQSRWSIPLDALAAKVKLDLQTVARKATLDVFTAAVLRSPVDTGRFRANWNVTEGSASFDTSDSTDETRVTVEIQKTLTLPLGGVTYLANGLPYAYRLEHGWSKQAPSGMVRLAAIEFDGYVREALKA